MMTVFTITDWEMFKTDNGALLMCEQDETVTLIEIKEDNLVNLVIVDEAADPLFDEQDAWTIVKAMQALKDEWYDTGWKGLHALLPIAFEQLDLPDDPAALAALVYCWHTPKDTLIFGEAGHRYLHHVHFAGKCWTISITQEMELDSITQL
jgi:hypothetical protein